MWKQVCAPDGHDHAPGWWITGYTPEEAPAEAEPVVTIHISATDPDVEITAVTRIADALNQRANRRDRRTARQ